MVSRYWESVKLPKCQRACLTRNLVNFGETFDVRLRLVLFDFGGGNPAQLELDDLQEPLRCVHSKPTMELPFCARGGVCLIVFCGTCT